MTLTEKIIAHLKQQPNHSDNDWNIANAIYDNCTDRPQKSNGGRIAAIRRACYKSDQVEQSSSSTWFLVNQ